LDEETGWDIGKVKNFFLYSFAVVNGIIFGNGREKIVRYYFFNPDKVDPLLKCVDAIKLSFY
jgi:hypothetical protein